MSILLDTNAFIWLIGPKYRTHLGKQARELIKQATIVYLSSISITEIHIKSLLGKLPELADISDAIAISDTKELNYTTAHADAISQFTQLKKHDPFDRMLLAQASSEGLILLTSDKILLGLGLDYVVNARV